MPVYRIRDREPVIGEGTWIAPTASIIGDVTIGKNCYIGFGAVIRGDLGSIVIGDGTAVEDNVVIHTSNRAVIGNRVIIGHMAMIHNADIRDNALVGMKSTVCDNTVIGEWSLIAEGSLVRKGQQVPDGWIYGGVPVIEIRELEKRHRDYLALGQEVYISLAAECHNSLERMD